MHHPVTGFEHLHRHSDFSLLDGFATCAEYAERSKEINQRFLCITDHGVMGAIPEQITQCDAHGLFPIFGMEGYVNPMQPKVANREESAAIRKSLGDGSKDFTPEQKRFDKSCHLLCLAYSLEGYSNLVRMSSWAWIHGFYKKPRINHEMLMKHKEGIIFTSGCGISEIAHAFMGDKNKGFDEEAGFLMVEKYIEMFGKNFYLEMMMLDWKMQKHYNAFLIKAHRKYGIPMTLSQDCFVKGTPILTYEGYKNIEDVTEGDMVFTHLNRWRKVEALASRPLRNDEEVFRVKTRIGGIAYEATGNHEVRTASCENGVWSYSWKRTDALRSGIDCLLMPKFLEKDIFAENDLELIDLLPFLEGRDYQIGTDYNSSRKGNMGCRLQLNEETNEFWSYQTWDRSNKTTIPRYLPLDEDLIQIIGWFIAEGWSEKEGTQVGFAFCEDEQHVADWIIRYFTKFGIGIKTYKVSEKGIAVRFSSVVFNRFFGQLCGFGANNKHLPLPDKKNWMRKWSKRQLSKIIHCQWKGDGSNATPNTGFKFSSTSARLIDEINLVLITAGIISNRSVVIQKNHPTWAPSHHLVNGASYWSSVIDFLSGKFEEVPLVHPELFDLGEWVGLPVVKLEKTDYSEDVFCFEVEEDHSFVSRTYVVSNCHVCRKEHSHNQMLMLLQKNKYTLADIELMKQSGEAEELFELQDTNLWMKSEDELNEKWESDYRDIIDYDLYMQAKANSVKIAELCKGVKLDREVKLPRIPDAEAKLWEETLKGFKNRRCPKEPKYIRRIREEYELIVEKGFASYFLIQKMMVDEARDYTERHLGFDGSYGVGPGRGSACGSLLAYCLCLHDLDPILHDLRFSRFLSPARGGKQTKFRHSISPVPHADAA
jgi:hypothetical protein